MEEGMNNSKSIGFNSVFKPVNQSHHRYRVLKGSAGSGKSVNIARDFVLKLSDVTYRGANLLCVRKVDESNRYSTYAELKKAIIDCFGEGYETYWHIQKTPLLLKSKITGGEVMFLGVNDDRQREKLKSIAFAQGKLTWIWIEEATELTREDVDILDDRLRGDLAELNSNLYYQITFTFNPVSASHWMKGYFFDRKDPMVLTHHSTYLDNRFSDKQYHERMLRRKALDPEGYRIYGLGEWGELGGLVLSNWEVEDFLIGEAYFDYMALGQDFGFNHANALLLLGYRDGNVYICDELYIHEKDTYQIMDLAEEKGFNKWQHLLLWCDSAEPDRIQTWYRKGYRARGVEKEPGCVNAAIDWLKRRKIFIHPQCVSTIKEIQQWKWEKDKETGLWIDQPVPFLDDAMAALRYGVESWRKSGMVNRDEMGV